MKEKANKEIKKAPAVSFRYFLYDFVRFTSAPGLLLFRPKKLYISPKAKQDIKTKGGALLISNHISMVDPMYLMFAIWRRRHHFIATKELFDGKFRKFLFTKAFLCILIDRDNFSMKTFKEIVLHLKQGEIVSMFPEGHVNFNEQGTNPFKSGMIVMALKSDCPIIPIYIKRRKHWYSRLIVAVGEAINSRDFAKGEIATLEEINNAAMYLQEQEKKLEELCDNYKKK